MTRAENRHNGGLIARDKLLARDPDYYSKIGTIGGKLGVKENLAENPDFAAKIGSQGGKRSKRGYKFIKETRYSWIYRRLSSGEEIKFSKKEQL